MEKFWNFVLVYVLSVVKGFLYVSLTYTYDVIIIYDGDQYHIRNSRQYFNLL